MTFYDPSHHWDFLYNAGDQLGISAAISDIGDFFSDAWDYVTNLDSPGGLGDLLTGGAYTQNATNREIAAENIAFQKEENEIIRQREDTAFQRGAADTSAAGLSKTLAAGNPASTTATTAPHNDYRMEKVNLLNGILNLKKTMQDVKTSNALADKYSAEAAGQSLSNGVFAEGFANEQAYKKALITSTLADAAYQDSVTELNKIKGKTYGDYLLAELDNLKTNTKLTNEEIVYKVAQKEHLSKEDVKILQDVLESQARVREYEHNLKVAKTFGFPTGSIPSGLLGSSFSTGVAAKNLMRDSAIRSWDPTRHDYKYQINGTYGFGGAGGYVW